MFQKFRNLTIWTGLTLSVAGCAVRPLTPTPEATATLPPVNVANVAFTPTAPVPSPTAIVFPTEAAPLPTFTPEVVVEVSAPTEAAPAPTSASAGNDLAGVAVGAAPTDTPAPSVAVAPPPSADVAAAEQYCIDWINVERAAAGVVPLVRDETLMGIARARVADMIARGYTGHNDPVTGEALGRAMMRAAGYASSYVGENWYGTIHGPPDIVDIAMTWFMTDPPHANNILNPNYVGVGVGIGFNGWQWLLVQNFAGQ